MDPITIGLAFAGLVLIGRGIKGDQESAKNPENSPLMQDIEAQVRERLKDASKISVPPQDTWVQVHNGNETWLVAPRYIAPVGIGEAARVAAANGCTLPTIALVNAIYAAADLKLDPHPRGVNDKPPSDFTAKTMNSPETNIAQLAYIQRQIEASNPEYHLLGGTHKDVVQDIIPSGFSNAGEPHLGIYGWHKRDGHVIQPFMWGHASGGTPDTDWKDYSQGLRLCKRIA